MHLKIACIFMACVICEVFAEHSSSGCLQYCGHHDYDCLFPACMEFEKQVNDKYLEMVQSRDIDPEKCKTIEDSEERQMCMYQNRLAARMESHAGPSPGCWKQILDLLGPSQYSAEQ